MAAGAPGRSATRTRSTTAPTGCSSYRSRWPRDAALTERVDAAPGLELRQGQVRRSGPVEASQTVDVRAEEPSWWSRPVKLG